MKLQLASISTVPLRLGGVSTFYSDLSATMANTTLTAAQKLTELQTKADAFAVTTAYYKNVAELMTAAAPMVAFGDWLLANRRSLSLTDIGTHVTIDATLTATIAIAKNLWDNLFAHSIRKGIPELKNAILSSLRAFRFAGLYNNTAVIRNDKELRRLANATAILPKTIFPIPVIPAAVSSTSSSSIPDYTALVTDINKHLAAVKEMRDRFEALLERSRLEKTIAPISTATRPNHASSAPQNPPASTNPFAMDVNVYTTDTKNLLIAIGVDVNMRYDVAIDRLNRKLISLQKDLWRYANLKQSIYKLGGSFWTNDQRATTSGGTGGGTTSPIAGLNYTDFYFGNDRCQIRPLGVGDMRRVEQTLCCYKPGEVSHIENILQGEFKDRSTRRLRRTEETFIRSVETEETREKDTITTDRFELEKETSKVTQQDTAFDLGISVAGPMGPLVGSINSSFSLSNSVEESNVEAVTYGKSVTTRALERIVERIREEQITKVIEEFEEKNTHQLDNRGGDKHAVGLYRWVDKVYNAKVVNYGKRLMFEFFIPEPGSFHLWAMAKPAADLGLTISKPIDPRSDELTSLLGIPITPIKSHLEITAANYDQWAAAYGADVEAPPAEFINVGTSFFNSDSTIDDVSARIVNGINQDITIPAGYRTVNADIVADFNHLQVDSSHSPQAIIYVGKHDGWYGWFQLDDRSNIRTTSALDEGSGILHIVYRALYTDQFTCAVNVKCMRTPQLYEAWQIKTYKAIIGAYQVLKAAYENKLAEAQTARGTDIQGTNPVMNRITEQQELKKGCIRWLFNGDGFASNLVTYAGGPDWTYQGDGDDCKVPTTKTDCSAVEAAGKVQFMEQCFEWKVMTYLFYPYFWGTKCRWRKLYQLSDSDTLFQNFLQAGMARVVVPVRPGYEEAALHFLRTGEIWNGGEVPGIDSDMYVSVVEDVFNTTGEPEESWEMRIPSTLTVLQCGSGCVEGDGLPCCMDEECGCVEGDVGFGVGTEGTLTGGGTPGETLPE
ncbi:MAG: hypothetical protein SH856_11710 [Flavobacteriales bacterium]|nr:hypothetical protein [Flavobacteriales bacterium]